MLASINGKKPARLLLATRCPRRKQLPQPQHGGRLLGGPPRRRLRQPDAAGSTAAAAAAQEEEAGGLQIWENTGRGLLLNGTHARPWAPTLPGTFVTLLFRFGPQVVLAREQATGKEYASEWPSRPAAWLCGADLLQ